MSNRVSTSYIKISTSKYGSFEWCPRKYFYEYREEDRNKHKKTNYPMLMGGAVHDHVEKMHRDGNSRNPFYYKTSDSAMGGFNGRWGYTIKENDAEIVDLTRYGFDREGRPKGYEIFRNRGRTCIHNYWAQMFPLFELGRGTPLEVEKRMTFVDAEQEVELVGVIDQIREIPSDRISKWNPNAISASGDLKKDYLPFILIDLKTGGHTYTPNGETAKNVNKKWYIGKKAKSQFSLHQNLQATFYTYLFDKHYGGLPLAFVFYYLRIGEFWPTYRTRKHYADMFEKINHLRGSLEIGSFPKRVSEKTCGPCVHFKRCSQEEDLRVVDSFQDMRGRFDSNIVAKAEEKKEEPKQMRLNMKVPRRKK